MGELGSGGAFRDKLSSPFLNLFKFAHLGYSHKNPEIQNPTIPGSVHSLAKGVLGWVLAAGSESQSRTGFPVRVGSHT